jgi:hypothetical protein
MKTASRNRDIFAKRSAGATLRALADEYRLTPERVRRICLAFTSTARNARVGRASADFTHDDFRALRDLVARYTLPGVVAELARIADNYGHTSPYYKRVARRLRATCQENPHAAHVRLRPNEPRSVAAEKPHPLREVQA